MTIKAQDLTASSRHEDPVSEVIMKNKKTLSFVVAAGLMFSGAALVGGQALAGELFEPSNSHLSQSTLASGSRLFVTVNDETAVRANERYVRDSTASEAVFAPTDRQAIAQWLARAERVPPVSAEPFEREMQSMVPASDRQAFTLPLRVTYSSGPFY